MGSFCYLENDVKTKEYIKLTVNHFKYKNNESIITLDNEIQLKEIQDHCNNSNGWDKCKLETEWVMENGKKFRYYLNSIKIASMYMIIEGLDIDKLSDEEFDKIRNKINGSSKLLDYIFV